MEPFMALNYDIRVPTSDDCETDPLRNHTGFLNIRFKDRNLEQAFREDYQKKSMFTIKVSLLFAMALYGAFGILDSQIVPDIKYEAWIIRFAIFIPFTLILFFLTYSRKFQKHIKLGLMLMGLAGGLGILAMIVLARPPGSDVYYVGLILTTMFYFIFLRLDFLSASFMAWGIFVLYEIAAIWIKGVSTFILINNTFFFASFNITGMVACYWIERYMRSDFLQRRTIIEQADKLNMIFEHSPVGIMHFDSQGVITACNSAFVKVLGSTRERIVGLRMLSDLKDQRVIESVKSCLAGKMSSHEGVYVSVTANKKAVGKALFAPVSDNDGAIVGGIGIIEDITERHFAEEALRLSEERYRSLYSMMRLMCDNVPDLIWAKDLQGKFIFVNRAMVEKLLCAADTDEPIGKTDMFFAQRHRTVNEERKDWFTLGEICVNSDEVVLSNRQAQKFDEYGNVRGEFLFLDVYKAPFIDETGAIIGTVGCGRDVTRERSLENERERAIAALTESEKKFRFITESVADVVWMMGLDLRINYISPVVEKFLGFRPDEREQLTIEQMVTPESLQYVRSVFSEELQKEAEGGHDPDRNIIMEVEHFRKDGSRVWGENNIRAIRNPDGTIAGILGLSRDITERKLHQHRLEKLNQCLLCLGGDYKANVTRLTYLCGELLGATCALYSGINRGMLCATGQWNTPNDFPSEDQPEGHICYDVITQDRQLLLVRDLQSTIYATTDPNVARYGLKTYMGSVVHRNDRPYGSLCVVFQHDFVPTEDQKHIIQIIASAISSEEDREMSRAQLRQRQAMEHLLLDISGRFIGVSSSQIDEAINDALKKIGTFCEVDRSYVFLFDHTNRTMSNTHEWCAEGISEEKNSIQNYPVSNMKELVSRLESGLDVHIPVVSGLGETWLSEREVFEAQSIQSMVVVPLFQYENLMGFVGFDSVRSVRIWEEWQLTMLHMFADRLSAALERRKAEDERNRLNAQLVWSQKMEAVGTLAGGVAHDFNNLLQVILGYSDAMLRDKTTEDRDFSRIKQILEAGKKGAELVRSLLTFSRKMEPKLSPTNLNHEVMQFQAFLSRTIPKTIKIDLRLNGDLRTALADSSQINQVLMNLGVNARDAMTDGGTLTIKTDNVELDHEYCQSHVGAKPGNYILLALSDTGHGMESETLEHIFEPFFTTKKLGKGTGLGLATVYGIVKQHGGYITCFSAPAVGTTFNIYLPALNDVAQHEDDPNETIVTGGNETLLVVDDEDEIRKWLKELLENYNYTVLTARNGLEAISVYTEHENSISLVVLDILMPEMDGKRCLKELKKMNPDVRVIVTSGQSGSDQSEMMMTLGADEFIGKPYEPTQLMATIRKILDKDS